MKKKHLVLGLIFFLLLAGCQREENINRIGPKAQKAIEEMEKTQIGPQYIKTEESFFDETTLHLFYEKKLGREGTDRYDAYDVFFDLERLEPERITKKGQSHTFDESIPLIGEDKAREIAQNLLAPYSGKELKKPKITTAKQDPTFMERLQGKNPSPSKEEGIIHKVYLFSGDEVEIAIDAYSGQLVGGDILDKKSQ